MSHDYIEFPFRQSFDEHESFKPLKNAFILLQEDLKNLSSVKNVALFKKKSFYG